MAKMAKVNRPNPGADPVAVTLTATITKGADIVTQAFTMNVLPYTDAEVVAKTYQELTDVSIQGANTSLSNVIGNLDLPSTGSNGSTITWVSSTPAFLTNAGLVTRPSFTQGSVNVTLEATISSGAETSKKIFNVVVYRIDQTTAEYLESQWANSTIQSQILNGNTNFNNISGNLIVPVSTDIGIVMTSSSTSVISNMGIVTRPSSTSANAIVTLTFALTKDGVTVTKTVSATVLHL